MRFSVPCSMPPVDRGMHFHVKDIALVSIALQFHQSGPESSNSFWHIFHFYCLKNSLGCTTYT